MEEKIILTGENGEILELYVVEETKINGVNYLLAAESEDGDADAWILKDISQAEAEDAIYVPVEDEKELLYISQIFAELLDDVDLV